MKLLFICILTFIIVSSLFAQSELISNVPFLTDQVYYQKLLVASNDVLIPKPQLTSIKHEKKSVGLALLYSLILPGMGEAYVGKTGYTKFFLSLEALGWGLYTANFLRAGWMKDDYRNYAVQHANVNPDSKGDQYWIDIGKYNSIYEYNEQRRRDRNFSEIYDENAINYWRWDYKQNRLFYDWKRIRQRLIERQDIYFIGGIVLNHIISAINAMRIARQYNREIDELSWNFDLKIDSFNGGISLSFVREF